MQGSPLKNPISSRISEMMMTATKVNVAFHTIPVTSRTSWTSTTPVMKANTAPPQADQPIDKFFGCQITSISVSRKITAAKIVEDNFIPPLCYVSNLLYKQIVI